MNFNSIIKFINNPLTILIILVIVFLSYFITFGILYGFENNFGSFGPTTNKKGEYALFLGMELNTWTKVIITYILIFISFLLLSYYELLSDIIKPLSKITHSNQLYKYIMMLLKPLFKLILYIINFHALSTFQIQYIIPQLLGIYIIQIPFTIKILHKKTIIQ